MDVLDQTKTKMNAAIDHFKQDLKNIRTGRAHASMLDSVTVDIYGTQMRLKELAQVTVPEPRMIVITPFDAGNLHMIVKGIEKANLNLLPVAEGNVIRIKIPEVDSSMRQERVKAARKKAEEAKIGIRNIRRDSNEVIKKQMANSQITEDVKKKLEKGVQDLTDKFCKSADDLTNEKEKEIMTV